MAFEWEIKCFPDDTHSFAQLTHSLTVCMNDDRENEIVICTYRANGKKYHPSNHRNANCVCLYMSLRCSISLYYRWTTRTKKKTLHEVTQSYDVMCVTSFLKVERTIAFFIVVVENNRNGFRLCKMNKEDANACSHTHTQPLEITNVLCVHILFFIFFQKKKKSAWQQSLERRWKNYYFSYFIFCVCVCTAHLVTFSLTFIFILYIVCMSNANVESTHFCRIVFASHWIDFTALRTRTQCVTYVFCCITAKNSSVSFLMVLLSVKEENERENEQRMFRAIKKERNETKKQFCTCKFNFLRSFYDSFYFSFFFFWRILKR